MAGGRDGEANSLVLKPGMSLEEAEKLLIVETLRHATSNREQAANLLGISRRALQYKLRHYGLLGEQGIQG